MARYGIFEILASIDKWIVIGVVASALISILVPAGSLNDYSWSQGIWGMLAVLLLSIPLYVCTTGSVPMVAALIATGMPAGSALVFLMAGPATNIATIGAMYRTLGRKAMAVYLAVVVSFSLLFGWLFEHWLPAPEALAQGSMAQASWWAWASAVLVALLLTYLLMDKLIKYFTPIRGKGAAMDMVIQVKDMSCAHCVQSVKKALEALEGVGEASPDLASGQVMITKATGQSLPHRSLLEQAIEKSGYSVVR
jgi:copper chaperone CopZ